MIFTTRMLSMLNWVGFLGRIARTASAIRGERMSSLPDCFEATTVRRAFSNSLGERRSATLSTSRSESVS